MHKTCLKDNLLEWNTINQTAFLMTVTITNHN